MTSAKQAYVDYQQRSRTFQPGSQVYLRNSDPTDVGLVVAVYPAIGMLDVEFPLGALRVPVEDVYLSSPFAPTDPPALTDIDESSLPGGSPVLKTALYWKSKNRQYKATSKEVEEGRYCCPRCKGPFLRKAAYKRRDSSSQALLACPECLFLIKTADIIGHPDYLPVDTAPSTEG